MEPGAGEEQIRTPTHREINLASQLRCSAASQDLILLFGV